MSALFFAFALTACTTEPQTSYCEALCDQAVACAENERAVADTLYTDCLTATESANENCAKQSDEGVNAAAAAALTECTDAIADAQAAEECGPFTGSIDELKLGTPAPECASQTNAIETYEAARTSTTETGPQLCTRFTTDWCTRVEECVIDQVGEVSDATWTALGGTASELCLASSGVSDFQTACEGEDRYAAESSLDDINLGRQGARECLTELGALSCGEVLSEEVPEVCAAAFTSTDEALAFASSVVSILVTVQDVVE